MGELFPSGSRGGWEPLASTYDHRPELGLSAKLAGWALALTFVPCFLNWFGTIALAVIALVRISDGRARGTGMAVTALVLSSVFLVATTVALTIDIANDPPERQAADHEASGDVSVLDLEVGDCLTKEPSATPQTTVPVGPCSDPHRGEVFAVFDIVADDGASQDLIDRLSEGGCVQRFAGYVGTGYDESVLNVLYLSPIAGHLDLDRGVACIVADPAGLSTGSLKDARR